MACGISCRESPGSNTTISPQLFMLEPVLCTVQPATVTQIMATVTCAEDMYDVPCMYAVKQNRGRATSRCSSHACVHPCASPRWTC